MGVFVLEAIRIPRGKGSPKGALHQVKPVDLLKTLFDEMRNRTAIDPSKVDEVILGCVGQLNDQGGNIAHTAALYAGWETRGSGTTVNSFCTSSVTACSMAAAKLLSGQGELYVVGGVESMSRVPILSDRGPLFTDPDVSSKVPFIPNGVTADFYRRSARILTRRAGCLCCGIPQQSGTGYRKRLLQALSSSRQE